MYQMNARLMHDAAVFTGAHLSQWVDAIGPRVAKHLEEFVYWPGHATTGGYGYTTTMVSVGAGTTVIVAANEEGGVAQCTTAGNEYDGMNMQLRGEPFKLDEGHPAYFGARAAVDHATHCDLVFGLAVTDTTLLATSTAHALNVNDLWGFYKLAGNTNIRAVALRAGAGTPTGTIGTLTTGYHTYELLWDGLGVTRLFLDGVELAARLTGEPTRTVTSSIAIRNGSAAARVLKIDWMRTIQLR